MIDLPPLMDPGALSDARLLGQPKPAIWRPAEHALLRPGAFRPVERAERPAVIADLVRTRRLTTEQARRAVLFVPVVGWRGETAGWSLVGSSGAIVVNNGTNLTLPGLPAEADIVIVAQGCDSEHIVAPNTSGYVVIGSSGSNSSPGYELHYKIMGSTPDSFVSLNAANGAIQANAVVIQVWRGVDQTNPLDSVAPTKASGSSGLPNAPAITPSTDGALVFAFGVLDDDDDLTVAAPSGYSNFQFQISESDSGSASGATTMLASKELPVVQSADPSAFGGTDSDEWAAVSFCLRRA
jgi:hypothetical protein